MKTILKTLILAVLIFNSAFAQSKGELKKMSVFVSNFVEARIYDIEKETMDKNLDELVKFGILHNNFNTYKSRIANSACPKKDSYSGIEVKYIKESVEKYFGYNLNNPPQLIPMYEGDENPIKLENNCYYFMLGDGDPVPYAKVNSFKKLNEGIVLMQGNLYSSSNGDEEDEFIGYFIAKAKEKTWNGKKTWELISIKSINIHID